ncbi:MAG: stress response translation initiation inhibitor YciH [Pseudomonadales bacterium]|nr:stress response translation initiation inhibitor YciH [Pseudomonadales bacterium]MBO6596049.1 stress response translation initiation inhibitor YciH [Pseudomonadales bacterium]MBO6822532.1 stress response translation initiation inhibitor YciH [Pseudomonadales bacterium]
MNKKRIVYSTDPSWKKGEESSVEKAPEGDGIVRLHRQTKGRNGKPVTLVKGLPLIGADLKAVAKELKNQCGVGGSIEGSDILIQGDKRDTIKPLLEAKGYTVKLAGG